MNLKVGDLLNGLKTFVLIIVLHSEYIDFVENALVLFIFSFDRRTLHILNTL